MKQLKNRFGFFPIFLFLFILLNVQDVSLQETSVYNGLKTITYSTNDGAIVMTYPEKLYSGSKMSGRLFIFPKAKKGKRLEKQTLLLNKLVFSIGETKIQGAGMFTCILPEDGQILFALQNNKGKQLFSIPVELHPKAASFPTYIPAFIKKEYQQMIRCASDGSFENVKLLINNRKTELLAVSETDIFFECPEIPCGKVDLKLETTDVSISQEVNIVQFDVSIGKSSLLPEEQTFLKLTINGLEDSKQELQLSLTNQSTSTISMEGGNKQFITISSNDINEAGVWKKNIQLTGKQRGDFSISTDLIIPEEEPQKIVDCDLDGYPVLLPLEICEKLHQSLDPANDSPMEYPLEELTEFPQQIEFAELPETVVKGEKIVLNLNFNEDFTPLFVIFNIYNLGTGIIQTTIVDSIPDNGFSLSEELNYDPGIYAIQATAGFGQNQKCHTTSSIIVQEVAVQNIEQNSEIFSLSNQLNKVDQSAINERNRITDLERQRDENNSHASNEENQAFKDELIVRELERIDNVLESTEDAYSEQLKQLLDSIIRFPPVPDTALLKGQLNRLQSALNACKTQFDRLQNEEKDLQNELPDVEQERLDAYHKITDLLRQTGNNFIAHRKTNKNGDLEYGYGLIFGSGSDLKVYRGAVPVQVASEVLAQERLIKNLNQRARQIRDRLSELPAIHASVQDECDRLQQEVNNARDAYEQAKTLAGQYSHLHSQRDEICRQIKNILNRLVIWCKNNPNLCAFQNQLDEFKDICPTDTIQMTNFWTMFNQIIKSKQGVEEQHRQQAEQHRNNANEFKKRAKQNRDDIDAANAKLERLARERRDIENKIKEAARIAEEQARINEINRKKREKEEMDRCIKKFTEWIAKNQQYLKNRNEDALKTLVDGMKTSGDVAEGIASGMARGATRTGAGLSGVASGLVNLGASLFYGWVQSAAESAVKKIGNKHTLDLLEAMLLGDNSKCGVHNPSGATSYFYLRKGNKMLVFRISATHGLEFLGER